MIANTSGDEGSEHREKRCLALTSAPRNVDEDKSNRRIYIRSLTWRHLLEKSFRRRADVSLDPRSAVTDDKHDNRRVTDRC